ncbi:MAG: hypothetical protein ACTSQI_09790 [Candidatus Helarchaeota archaeon]
MSIEKRRRLKKKAKTIKPQTEKKARKNRAYNPKKDFSKEEIEARKKAQRLSMFEKKKKTYKR